MLLSRFWYVILAILATVGLMAAMVASNVVNEQSRDAVEDDLARDRTQVEQTLRLEARTRLDALAPFAANAEVRSALRRASRRDAGEPVSEEIATDLAEKIAELNGQLAGLRGELLFAVDDEGWIVSAVAPNQIPAGAGLGHFPLVARALQGYVRDDVWVYNEEIYRMAARPVIDGGDYVGAIIHGKRVDDGLAELLSNRLGGATIAFFVGTEMKAGHMPSSVQSAPRREELAEPLSEVLEDEALERGERTDPQALPTGGLAVYSLVTGTAREADVGYAIARPLPTLQEPWDLVLSAPEAQWVAVLKLWWLWAILAGFIVVAMFSVWLERDRPLGKMRKATAGLKDGPDSRLTATDFGGQYRKIAHAVNEALDAVAQSGGAAGPKRKAANLDELLGPNEGTEQPAFFGFAQQDTSAADLPEPPPAEPAKPAAREPATPKPAAPTPPAAPSAPTPPAAPPNKPLPPKPPAPPKLAGPPAPQAPAAPSAEPAKPGGSQRKHLKRTLLGVPPPVDDEDEEEGATMVARVPEELLAQSASQHTGDDEDAHFREVYQKFVDTKKQCGEPTTGLTFEKFVVTLRKNRDQIVSRHGARKVRFTVYVKAGKAALKATPIRE